MARLHEVAEARARAEKEGAGLPARLMLDLAELRLGAFSQWLDHCEEAAGLYRCEAVGIDLLFEAGFHRHFILEVNAFGDFFPGLLDGDGRSIPSLELEETARRVGWL